MNKIKESLEYAKWIESFKWDFFCTLTTRYSMSMPLANKFMERYFDILKKDFPEIRLFGVAEPFDTKEGNHIHALISLSETESFTCNKELIRAWQKITKGSGGNPNRCSIVPYIKGGGGNNYMCKYMLRNNAEYAMLGFIN